MVTSTGTFNIAGWMSGEVGLNDSLALSSVSSLDWLRGVSRTHNDDEDDID